MTDEQVGKLDVVPEVFPDSLLGSTLLVDQIATEFDVGTVDDGNFGPDFLDERNETRHLGVICDEMR